MIVVTVLIVASPNSPPVPQRATPFALDSIWNAALPANAPVAANSAALVAELGRQVSTYGTFINSYSYSTPIYTVAAGQTRVPVILDQANSQSAERLTHAFASGVPIPADARAANGTDGDLVVWQPATDTMWELWMAHHVGGAWHAEWGGRMESVSANPGYFTDPPDWGTAATSLSLLGGTIRISDLRAGHIDHALSISIPQARAGVFVSPAQRTDGKLDSPSAIPEGTRFRLDPKLDIRRLGLGPVTRMLAEAAQRYGMFVRDQGGSVAFYAEQNTGSGPDPYYKPGGLFRGQSPQAITAAFPWRDLQVIEAPQHSLG